MSAFAAKRRARKIQVQDDEEAPSAPAPAEASAPAIKEDGEIYRPSSTSSPADPTKLANASAALQPDEPQKHVKFGKRPFKSSSLRKSVNFNDVDEGGSGGSTAQEKEEEEDGGAPVVIRSATSRPAATKQKKKTASSRLSFGPGADDTAAGAETAEAEAFTPKKGVSANKAGDSISFRKSASLQRLPGRAPGDDEDRPRYSKEYLDELQNSTPNTPQNLASLQIDDDEMDLDSSELEGAMVVQSTEVSQEPPANRAGPTILTESEIREKKERRARLGREQDFISLDDDGQAEANGNYISLLPEKKEEETRLVAEDEDLGEGYDDFVEDGGLSLGRKAERDARRRQRQEMADLINRAEGAGSDEDTDDSEAERRAAYDAAQTRSAMDGLHREGDEANGGIGNGHLVIPKMKPLPDLGECLERMRNLVQGMEDEVARKRERISGLETEKEEILSREKEVQTILDQAGARYQEISGSSAAQLAAQSPLRPGAGGAAGSLTAERGLESLGTTPTARPDVEDMGQG